LAQFLVVAAHAQRTGMKSIRYSDTFASEKYVSQFVRYQRYLPFIKYSDNYVEWADATAIDNFYAKLANADHKKVKVLHIGDSHIQADFFTGYIRENIQSIFGYGGRGFIFPYACAGTHSTYDYRTWKYGSWEGARNVKNPNFMDIGIAGAVAKTTDNEAGFKFGFKEGIIMEDFTVLKIYCKKDSGSFNLKLKLNNHDDTIYLTTNARPDMPYVRVDLPVAADTFEVFMDQTDSIQNFFECYGLMVESCHDKGVLYNSVGINGAGFNSILGQTLMKSQLEEMKPDLVVLDLGANDFYGYTFDEKALGSNLALVIKTIKEAAPKASVVVSCSQDIYRKHKSVFATLPFSQLAQKTAKENGAAWYDYFSVSGGRYSMLKWRRYQLAKKDKVHLTTAGYNLKGDLYLNAFLNSYLQYLKGRPESLIVANGNLVAISDSLFVDKNGLVDPENDTTKTKITHTVKKGEKMATIAKKYKVDADDIMDWNGLESAYLRRGQKLEIFIDKPATAPQTATKEKTDSGDKEKETVAPQPKPKKEAITQKTAPKKETSTSTVRYKVKSGDTLWGIAQQHGTTVANIKKLNNLRRDAIRAGQTLIISR
jgi:LysM repeat protein